MAETIYTIPTATIASDVTRPVVSRLENADERDPSPIVLWINLPPLNLVVNRTKGSEVCVELHFVDALRTVRRFDPYDRRPCVPVCCNRVTTLHT